MRHYGGYCPTTPENRPLIDPMRTPGAFMAGSLSGFGTTAATATGEVCAASMEGTPRPPYAGLFTPRRHEDAALMAECRGGESKGVVPVAAREAPRGPGGGNPLRTARDGRRRAEVSGSACLPPGASASPPRSW